MIGSTDVATNHTLSWLRPQLGPAPQRILEVGCGRGEVAAALVRDGHDVLAIDVDADCVEHAQILGVAARVVQFPHDASELGEDRFDVVLFARVLHHIELLPLACEKSRSLLVADGKVLLEDFAWEAVDARTAAWFFGLLRIGRALGIVPDDDWRWDVDPLAGWREPYVEHELHTGEAMLAALAERFTIDSTEVAPYAYRWFARYLERDDRGYNATQAILDAETTLIQESGIVPIGLRAVARHTLRKGASNQEKST